MTDIFSSPFHFARVSRPLGRLLAPLVAIPPASPRNRRSQYGKIRACQVDISVFWNKKFYPPPGATIFDLAIVSFRAKSMGSCAQMDYGVTEFIIEFLFAKLDEWQLQAAGGASPGLLQEIVYLKEILEKVDRPNESAHLANDVEDQLDMLRLSLPPL